MSGSRHLVGVVAATLLLVVYARVPQAWGLGFVALVPWLLALDGQRRTRDAVLGGVLMSVAFVAGIFGWFGSAIGAYTGMGVWAASTALLVLAPLLQPQLLAYALVRHGVGRRHAPLPTALAAASAWVACEWVVPKLLGDTLAHGLFPSTTLRQVADLGGAAGMTFLMLLVNEAVAAAIQRRQSPRAVARPLVAGVLVVVAMWLYGSWRLATLPVPGADDVPRLRIAMVQSNITDYERLRRERGAYAVVRHVLDTHYALSMSALRDHDADVLLWSETVYPTTFGRPRSEDGAALDREIEDFVDTVRVPLVFGSYDVDGGGEYNAAIFLEPGAGRLGTYRKTHPFPLTEHVPPWLDRPLVRRLLPWAGTWQPGDGARVMPLRTADGREVNVVPLICLDDVRPGLAIEGARLGAQAIVGMSNDSWFTDRPIGARLHLAVAAFRSVETRMPQVRVTTNGLSALIDHTGEVVAGTAMGQQAVLTAPVAARSPPATLMVRWGDWVGRAGLGFLFALAALSAWRRWRSRAAGVAPLPVTVEVAVLPPAWRAVVAALRVCAGLGLTWIAIDMATRTGWQVQSLSQLRRFVVLVVLPTVAAWVATRFHTGMASIEHDVLVLEQSRRRVEIPLASIVGLSTWRVPVPRAGVSLRLASGGRWENGLVLRRPESLRRMLAAAGAPLHAWNSLDGWLARFAEVRGRVHRAKLDHGLVKFALFPLLPALVAFRLHQVIAFGSPFGEYHSYGALAWWTGLAIWWASWSLGMMLFAALLRTLIEILCVAAGVFARDQTIARDALEWAGRLAYYIGVPAWLAIRLLESV